MVKWIVRVVLLAAVVLVGTGIFRWLFPDDRKVIATRLKRIAELATFSSNEAPLTRLGNAKELSNFFAGDVEVLVDVPGMQAHTIQGRDELFQMAMAARATSPSVTVEFPDVVTTVDADKTGAESNLTLKARVTGQPELIVQEMAVSWKKMDGAWRITKLRTVKTLQ